MEKWSSHLDYDAIRPLVQSDNTAIITFAKRDLLSRAVHVEELWTQSRPQNILRKQQADGSWLYPGASAMRHIRSQENYNQVETYRNLGLLVELYGFNKEHAAIKKAAEWLIGFQSDEGDIRGIYGNQFTPNYTASITELLIKAGYKDDPRVKKVFDWLLSVRQDDGGWAIPIRTLGYKLDAIGMNNETLRPNASRPSSWMVTGVVLRAFAAHRFYRNLPEVSKARDLLLSSLFKKDKYPDRGNAEYWLRFSYPFWFTDLISALDSLSQLGCNTDDEQIMYGLEWFIQAQLPSGLWNLKILKGKSSDQLDLWLSLAICRVFKRFFDS